MMAAFAPKPATRASSLERPGPVGVQRSTRVRDRGPAPPGPPDPSPEPPSHLDARTTCGSGRRGPWRLPRGSHQPGTSTEALRPVCARYRSATRSMDARRPSGRAATTMAPPNPPPVSRAPKTPWSFRRQRHQPIEVVDAHLVVVAERAVRCGEQRPEALERTRAERLDRLEDPGVLAHDVPRAPIQWRRERLDAGEVLERQRPQARNVQRPGGLLAFPTPVAVLAAGVIMRDAGMHHGDGEPRGRGLARCGVTASR